MKREALETAFGRPFKYPNIYRPRLLINGLDEASIPVIIKERPGHIDYAIWGLLPEHYRDDWYIFQNSLNTLNIAPEMIGQDGWIRDTLVNRRCMILVSGFFVMHLYEGELYPYFVRMRSGEAFALAGIYNVLDDGFVTASLLLGSPNHLIEKINNIGKGMPIILQPEAREHWLEALSDREVLEFTANQETSDLIAHPIARELYNQNISYKSMLEPVTYQNIPMPQL